MNGPAERLVVGFTQGWVALYTSGLAPERREAQRAEIASNLCEQLHNSAAAGLNAIAAEVLGRVLAGAPADVTRSVEERGSAWKEVVVGTPWSGQRKLQSAILWSISVLVVAATLGAIEGLPAAASAAAGVLAVLAVSGLVQALLGRPVEARVWCFVGLGRNGRSNPALFQVAADRRAAVPLVASDRVGTGPGTTTPWSLDRPALHQGRQHRLLVPLAAG